nr:unnamed protein product [Spirometra erinaceieuropaei]
MALDGVPAKVIAIIKTCYRSTTARVLARNNLPQSSGIRSGIRQGCILSPILFNYVIGWILVRALHESDGVEFAPGHRLTDLDYTDDIVTLASSFRDLQSMVSRVNEFVGASRRNPHDAFRSFGQGELTLSVEQPTEKENDASRSRTIALQGTHCCSHGDQLLRTEKTGEMGVGYTFFLSSYQKAERRDTGDVFVIRNDIAGRLPCPPHNSNNPAPA